MLSPPKERQFLTGGQVRAQSAAEPAQSPWIFLPILVSLLALLDLLQFVLPCSGDPPVLLGGSELDEQISCSSFGQASA